MKWREWYRFPKLRYLLSIRAKIRSIVAVPEQFSDIIQLVALFPITISWWLKGGPSLAAIALNWPSMWRKLLDRPDNWLRLLFLKPLPWSTFRAHMSGTSPGITPVMVEQHCFGTHVRRRSIVVNCYCDLRRFCFG